MLQEEDEYLEFLAMSCNIEWEKEKIYLPFDRGDQSVIIENQRTSKKVGEGSVQNHQCPHMQQMKSLSGK